MGIGQPCEELGRAKKTLQMLAKKGKKITFFAKIAAKRIGLKIVLVYHIKMKKSTIITI